MNRSFLAALAACMACSLAACGRDAGQDVSPEQPQGGSTAGPTPKAGGTGTDSGTGTTGGQGNYGTTSPIGPSATGGGTTDTTPRGARLQEPASAAAAGSAASR
jgi:hypothetical protein